MWSSRWISFIADYSENLKTGSDLSCELEGESNAEHFLWLLQRSFFKFYCRVQTT